MLGIAAADDRRAAQEIGTGHEKSRHRFSLRVCMGFIVILSNAKDPVWEEMVREILRFAQNDTVE